MSIAKPVLTPQQFIDLVNERLPDHQMFEQGMRVFLFPVGATSATALGYGFEPPAAAGVVADIVARVREEYDVSNVPPVVRGHP
jgi:hypothetical protein